MPQMSKCQVLILYSGLNPVLWCKELWCTIRSMSVFWAGPCKPCASSAPLLSPHLLTSAICLFSYLHPKICPSVFRNSMRIHCCLKIDNKWNCVLRNCPALACCCCLEFLSAEVWITLEETSLPGGSSQCFGEAMECSKDAVACSLRPSPKEPKVYPICRTTPEAC